MRVPLVTLVPLVLVSRFSVAVQTEGQHPFMQVDELPLEGLHNGRFYQVGDIVTP